MPKRRIDEDTYQAIRVHWVAVHGGEIPDEAIALERKGRLASTTRATVTPESRVSPAWFVCRECAPGMQRYRTDLGADPASPPARHVRMIRTHLREAHGVVGRDATPIVRGIGTDSPVCYLPARRSKAPMFTCDLCLPAHRLRVLDEPAYGDARSFWELTPMSPVRSITCPGRSGRPNGRPISVGSESRPPSPRSSVPCTRSARRCPMRRSPRLSSGFAG